MYSYDRFCNCSRINSEHNRYQLGSLTGPRSITYTCTLLLLKVFINDQQHYTMLPTRVRASSCCRPVMDRRYLFFVLISWKYSYLTGHCDGRLHTWRRLVVILLNLRLIQLESTWALTGLRLFGPLSFTVKLSFCAVCRSVVDSCHKLLTRYIF